MPRQTRNSLLGRGDQSATSLSSDFSPKVSHPVPSVQSTAEAEEIEPEDNVCHICKEEYHTGPEPEAPVTLPCGHRFGLACLHQWTQVPERNHACPLCNRHLYPDAVRQRQQLAHAPLPQRSIDEILQDVAGVLMIRNRLASEAWPGDNDYVIIAAGDGDSAIMTRTWLVGELRRLGRHDEADNIDNRLRSGPSWQNPFLERVGRLCCVGIPCLLDALDMYLWWRVYFRPSRYVMLLSVCVDIFRMRFFRWNAFMRWFGNGMTCLWVLSWFV